MSVGWNTLDRCGENETKRLTAEQKCVCEVEKAHGLRLAAADSALTRCSCTRFDRCRLLRVFNLHLGFPGSHIRWLLRWNVTFRMPASYWFSEQGKWRHTYTARAPLTDMSRNS